LFFSGARHHGEELATNASSRAAEKQKECVAVAFYKQATTNVVERGSINFRPLSRLQNASHFFVLKILNPK